MAMKRWPLTPSDAFEHSQTSGAIITSGMMSLERSGAMLGHQARVGRAARHQHIGGHAGAFQLMRQGGEQRFVGGLRAAIGCIILRHMVSRLVVTLMMRPQRCANSVGTTARVIRNVATILTSMMRRNSSGVVSHIFPTGWPSRRNKRGVDAGIVDQNVDAAEALGGGAQRFSVRCRPR